MTNLQGWKRGVEPATCGATVREDCIVLTNGMTVWLDAADYLEQSKYVWYAMRSRKTWYAFRYVGPRKRRTALTMHRAILGVTDQKILVDHRNCNGLDNRRANLRLCDRTQNGSNNTRPGGKHGFKGVYFDGRHGGRWQARISVDAIQRHLGNFDTAEEAARAFDKAARELRGEFAVLNFPEETCHVAP